MGPGFKPEELAARYDVEQFSEDEWHTYSGEQTKRLLSRYVTSGQGIPNVLLNAGSGVYQLGLAGWREIAVDLFDSPIRSRPGAVRGDIQQLEFPAGSFGAVVCVGEVLGYCDPVRAIKEFARVTAPNGLLVCDFRSTLSFRCWFSKEFKRAADLVTDEYKGSPEPVWVYDPGYILSLVKSSGFSIKAVHGFHTWSALARRLGTSPIFATTVERWFRFLPRPTVCADIKTIVAVRDELGPVPQ